MCTPGAQAVRCTPGAQAASLLLALLAFSLPAFAAGDQSWKDQDSWERFSEREQHHSFKFSHPEAAKPPADPILAPILSNKNQPPEPGKSYVILPGTQQAPVQPKVHVETTYVPAPVTSAPAMVAAPGFGLRVGGWGARSWGMRGYGYGYGNGYGWGGGLLGPGMGVGFSAPSAALMRPVTHVVQDGPSKPSGNYYSPSTADPTASGPYYASPDGLPKAAPIIQEGAQQRDYWGKNGNPLPSDMQP